MRIEQKRDLGWAVLIGAVFAASPLTGAARPNVSIVLGVFITAAIYLVRVLIRPRLPHLFSDADTPRVVGPIPLPTWGLLIATLLAFAPTIAWLYNEYTVSIWRNIHGLFIPVILFILIRARLRQDSNLETSSSKWGAPVLLLGVFLAVIDAGVRLRYTGTVGMMFALVGLSLLLLGARRTRSIAFPLALAVFLLPIPHYYPDPFGLTSGTSFMMEKYLHLTDIPAYRHNHAYFTLPVGVISVSSDCAGISFFYAAFLIALILARETNSKIRKLAILLVPWPLTVVVNGVRGMFLAALSNAYGYEMSESSIHGLTGIATFWAVVFGPILLTDWRQLLGANKPT
jgi:exosortase